MKDRDFLIWIHERLANKPDESPLLDYMHRLRCIIAKYPKNKETFNDGTGENSMEELKKKLKIKNI